MTLRYPKVPENLLTYIKREGLEIDNSPSKHDETVAHIQLLSNQPKGQIFYISEDESISQMGEPTAREVSSAEFDISDLIGDIIFIKYFGEDKGKFWKYRPMVKPEVLSHFPKTLFESPKYKSSIQSQLTLFQKMWLNSKFPEYDEKANGNVFISTILINKDRFPLREGHNYIELYYNKDEGTANGWQERVVPTDPEDTKFVGEVPGFVLDIYNGKVSVHIFNPYYYKQ